MRLTAEDTALARSEIVFVFPSLSSYVSVSEDFRTIATFLYTLKAAMLLLLLILFRSYLTNGGQNVKLTVNF